MLQIIYNVIDIVNYIIKEYNRRPGRKAMGRTGQIRVVRWILPLPSGATLQPGKYRGDLPVRLAETIPGSQADTDKHQHNRNFDEHADDGRERRA